MDILEVFIIHNRGDVQRVIGEFIELAGNLITDKYGANEPDETKAMILRYGLTFDGTNGYMKCKTEGTYIGNHEVSFLVSNEYGRSLPASNLKQIHRNGIGMYQTFTEISDLSLNEGSTEGKTLLTIHGQYFDETDAKAQVFIGDKECTVQPPISETEIKCLTPKDASENQPHYSGGRGLYVYIQNGTIDASTIDRSKAAMEHIDQSSWSASNWGPHAIQMVGFFVPLNSGSYTFCLNAASSATLYMSSDNDPTNKLKIISGTSCTNQLLFTYKLISSKYYTEVYYGSSSSNSFVTLIAHSLKTDLTPEMTGLAQYEVQDINFKSSVNPEIQSVSIAASGTAKEIVDDIQTITFLNSPDASVVFRLDGVFTVPMQINQLTSTILQTELKNLPNAVTIVKTDVKSNSSHITIEITSSSTEVRTVLGKPNLTTFTLTMDDIPTKPLPINAAASEMCLAYKGQGQVNYIRVYFAYKDSNFKDATVSGTFSVPNKKPSDWSFWCGDILNLFNSVATGTAVRIEYVQVYRRDTSQDLYIDQLLFHKVSVLSSVKDEDIYLLRMPQAQPNGAFINTITVEGSYPAYTIKLQPHNCGYNLPLFGVAFADKTDSIYTINNGGFVSINITSVKAASPPIGGSYTVTFNGETTPDPVQVSDTLSPDPLIGGLSSMSVGFSKVEVTGTCSAFKLRVTMLSLTGDQPLILIGSSNLTGNDVTVSVQKVTDGGVWLKPIMGDLLRTYHSTPQVLAFINNVPTRCQKNLSCSFTWSSNKTPTVTNIEPNNGSEGTSVKITGAGFDDTSISNNEVFIGKTPCAITVVTSNLITCNLGNGATGKVDVFVTVVNKGLAKSSVQFTYITEITSFSPSSGSVEGGTLLTINGKGFTADANITIDSRQCYIENLTQSTITCRTPRAQSFNSDTTAEIVVAQFGSSKVPGNFSYKLSETPIVYSVSTSTSKVNGGEHITITGKGFGSTPMTVKLENVTLNVSSYSDTSITAVLPALPDGRYRLIIDIHNNGFADLRQNNIPDIAYTLNVQSVSPDFGSLYGGTDLVITGNGFSLNSSEMSVTVGPHNCSILKLSETSIKCRIEGTGKYHIVSATGKHKILGYGYAWDKDPITIQVGDYITWTWQTPQYVSDMAYSVQQTATPFDLFSLPGGFSSGAKKRIGSFTHRFTTVGNFYYWTGYMDSESSIYFRGTVIVLAQKSYSAPLTVKLLGFEARHNTSSSSQVPIDTNCSSVVDKMSGCVDSVSLTESTDHFQFKFLKCYSPYIDSISLDHGTFSDVISFSGKGLGTEACQNEVIYGTSKCVITSSTETSINLTISAEKQPPIGELLEFSPRVVNLGYALIAIPRDAGRRFALLPRIQSISPSKGSNAGGTLLTINGDGFQGDANSVSVELTSLSCLIKSVTYTKVICETRCESACNSGNQTVSLKVGDGSFPAVCDPSVCLFTSLDEYTAVLSSISPSEVSNESTVLTIIGSNFNTSVDNLLVKIGGQDCPIKDNIENNQFTCTIGRLPVGANDIKVYVGDKGLAATSQKVTSKAVAAISLPESSSVNGGALLVIDGNGFTANTSVKVDTLECPLVNISLSQVTCILPAHAEGTAKVSIVSNKITYNSLSISYSLLSTPKVTSITPNEGTENTKIIITGTGFNSPAIGKSLEVKIGGVACTNIKDVTDTSITCTTGAQNTGEFPVQVFVEQKGFSNSDIMFTYQLGSFTVSPTNGSTNGGQLVTLTGSGFLEGKTSVTICGAVCGEVSVTTSSYVCKTSAVNGSLNSCDIVANVEGVSYTQTSAYSYDNSLDTSVTSVSPSRGGTGGGTVLTITGTNFGSTIEEISVKISGAVCNVTSVTDTQILCRTGAASSGTTTVQVQRNNWGLANQINAVFQYIDLWSSRYTWGGQSPPTDGDFVVIPPNQIILLDTNTTVLKMLLIQGGQLIFDENNIELQAENILITNNGLLQVGSAEKPFPKQYKAIITLHGHLRSKELPVYGTKTLAIREGTLNLFGSPVNVVWTRLASTASAGSTILNLEHEVDWSPGDEIVIATTGDKFSQKETEVRKIVSVNGANVTLEKALDYEHLSIVGQFGDRTVDFKAEVGLLTRNVVVRGHRNVEFDTQIPACAAGFDPGEFATQTCFQGRFGEELGSDQFGGQIMVHQMEKDTQVAQAHLQYIEVTFAGQAFRLGRYAIHFHMNGNMNKSFVRGCAIHKSFNRAVNIHGSHNSLVEHNVVYDIMGGALFLEDGNEVGNTFQYNLVLFVRSSTSLRNDDITPAGFWATNPNNIIRHNNVAGGTHFGVWYRMHVHPDGPGFDVKICPQATPLGEYSNNTAHSLGWFGLWIFETYIPRVGSSCSSSADHQVAKFYTLTAWSCDKGAEAVNIGAVQFHNFTLVNNLNAGFESKLVVETPPQYDANRGPGIFNTVIAAYYNGLRGGSSSSGVVIPYQTGFLIKGVQFFNFDQPGHATVSWTRIAGVCTHFCGGFTVETEGLQFINSPNKVRYEWESEGVVLDRDGSLTGNANYSVAPCTPSFDSNKCTLDQGMSVNVNGCICASDIKLIRFSFNNILPTSLKGVNASFSTEFGTSYSPFAPKRITHPKGWSFVLMANHYYKFSFENADKISNMSYDSVMYRLDPGDFIVFTQYAEVRPDIFSLNGQQTTLPISSTMLSGSNVNHGQWFYNDTEKSISYAVGRQSKRKRSIYMTAKEIRINARCIKCFYLGCQPPQDPLDILVRPSSAEYWSYISTWSSVTADGSEPKPLTDLVIPKNKWIIVDKPLPKLGKLVIEGGLEFLQDESRDVVLDVEYLLITGRFVAGWNSSAPLNGKLVIRIRGSKLSTPYNTSSGPLLGTRFIGVYGGLQLHGKDRGIIKTYLASTVDYGKVITVTDAVSWVAGDVILLTTTDYHPWHTETFTVASISGKTITLNDTIKYRHI
ncbi:Fibrocystin-L, partial [Bulinus truncatus]